MDRVFVDCDVALDFLAKREPFHGAARDLFVLFELKKVKGFVSPLLCANVSYVLRKQVGRGPALAALAKLSLLVELVPLSGKAVALALASALPDFEDALQYYAAQEARIPTIVTRNAQHYPRARLTVCSAEQFLAYRAARAPRG